MKLIRTISTAYDLNKIAVVRVQVDSKLNPREAFASIQVYMKNGTCITTPSDGPEVDQLVLEEIQTALGAEHVRTATLEGSIYAVDSVLAVRCGKGIEVMTTVGTFTHNMEPDEVEGEFDRFVRHVR